MLAKLLLMPQTGSEMSAANLPCLPEPMRACAPPQSTSTHNPPPRYIDQGPWPWFVPETRGEATVPSFPFPTARLDGAMALVCSLVAGTRSLCEPTLLYLGFYAWAFPHG